MIHSDPLRTTELLALIDEATAPVRHDVRNRIASMRNLAFFVRRKLGAENAPERDPRMNEFLLKIESEVQRTDEVIDVWSTKVQSVRPLEVTPVSVSASVRLAVDCSRLPAAVKLALLAMDDTLQVEADPDALALAVRCLIENAGEAAPAGSVSVRVERQASDCHVIVVDDGPGIDDRERAFERFETKKPGHLGLGLCIARRIATRFGGDLSIGSPTRGAEVGLRLPIAGTRTQGAEP